VSIDDHAFDLRIANQQPIYERVADDGHTRPITDRIDVGECTIDPKSTVDVDRERRHTKVPVEVVEVIDSGDSAGNHSIHADSLRWC
jgi:hypothetical protein